MNSTDESDVLIIQFAKWPIRGKVKTRLIPALGEQGALEAHITLSCAVLDNLMGSGFPVEFWWDREPDEQARGYVRRLTDKLEQANITQRVQRTGDLGERMLAALEDGLRRAGRVIIVGSDCPAVDGDHVRCAVAALENTDVVLGPAEDGGYVLIGVQRVERGMFFAVEWGTERALVQTLDRAIAEGLTVSLLDTLWDVDEVVGWERFLRDVQTF